MKAAAARNASREREQRQSDGRRYRPKALKLGQCAGTCWTRYLTVKRVARQVFVSCTAQLAAVVEVMNCTYMQYRGRSKHAKNG